MGVLEILWRAKTGIIALMILGFVELLVMDVSATSLKISIIGGGIFILLSPMLGFLSVLVAGWEAVKHTGGKGSMLTGAKIGALVAFAASFFVDAMMLAMSLFGRGVAKLFPSSDAGVYPMLTHALLLIAVPAAYAILGAAAGACAVFIARKK